MALPALGPYAMLMAVTVLKRICATVWRYLGGRDWSEMLMSQLLAAFRKAFPLIATFIWFLGGGGGLPAEHEAAIPLLP